MSNWQKWIYGLLVGVMSVPYFGIVNPASAYPTSFVYEAENLLSAPGVGHPKTYLGSPTIQVMHADTVASNQGFMIYGPYTSDQLPGKKYRATFSVRTMQATANPVVRLEVNNFGGNILNDYTLTGNDFSATGVFNDFSLEFTRPATGTIEYRAWYYKQSDIEIDKVTVEEVAPSDSITYESEQLRHKIGHVITDPAASGGKAVLATIADGTGHMQYGPYSVDQDVNNTFKATFRLKVSNNTSSAVVARIDAANAWGGGEWTFRDLKGTDFAAPNTYQDFPFVFQRINAGSMEYRILAYGVTDITADYVRVEKITQSANTYESEMLSSALGSIVVDNNASLGMARQATPDNGNGYIQYGPYTVDQAPGSSYRATFTLSVDNNTVNSNVARIEAFNQNGDGVWRFKNIKANDFQNANQYQNFSVDFARTSQGNMEYRVYYYGNVTLRVDKVSLFKLNNSNWNYEAEDSPASVGNRIVDASASGGMSREATVVGDDQGFMLYGPYSDDQPSDSVYSATFNLKTRNNNTSANVARIDVSNPGGNSVYVSKEIKGSDFTSNNTWQPFTLNFYRRSGGTLEFRVWFYDQSDILVDNVVIASANQNPFVYQAEKLPTVVGSIVADALADGGFALKSTKNTSQGFLVYGPYSLDQTIGNYQVTFRMKRGAPSTTAAIARVEVVNDNGSGSYVWKDITPSDVGSNYTDVNLNFYRTGEGTMEYRVYVYNNADIYVDKITVSKI